MSFILFTALWKFKRWHWCLRKLLSFKGWLLWDDGRYIFGLLGWLCLIWDYQFGVLFLVFWTYHFSLATYLALQWLLLFLLVDVQLFSWCDIWFYVLAIIFRPFSFALIWSFANLRWIIDVVFIPWIISLNGISSWYNILLPSVDYKFEKLTNSNININFETLQLGVILARDLDLPRTLLSEFTEYFDGGIWSYWLIILSFQINGRLKDTHPWFELILSSQTQFMNKSGYGCRSSQRIFLDSLFHCSLDLPVDNKSFDDFSSSLSRSRLLYIFLICLSFTWSWSTSLLLALWCWISCSLISIGRLGHVVDVVSHLAWRSVPFLWRSVRLAADQIEWLFRALCFLARVDIRRRHEWRKAEVHRSCLCATILLQGLWLSRLVIVMHKLLLGRALRSLHFWLLINYRKPFCF